MICHKHKCILVHIPACAGSSMEKAIVGYDWWDKDPETKHLKSHQAKKIYSEYWSDYFKFSFVRNPWSRTLSLAQHKCHKVHVNHKTKEINLYSDELNLVDVYHKTGESEIPITYWKTKPAEWSKEEPSLKSSNIKVEVTVG